MKWRRTTASVQDASWDPLTEPRRAWPAGDHTGRPGKHKPAAAGLASVQRLLVRLAATYRPEAKTRYVSGLYLVLTALKCGGFCGSEPSWKSGPLKGRLHDRQACFGHFRASAGRRP